MNFAGAFISIAVATTIAKGVVDNDAITLGTLLAGLVGAIAWNLMTWLVGLPSSSSHALIGGVVGATLAAKGADAVNGSGILEKVIVPALLAPLIAGLIAIVATFLAYRLIGVFRERNAQRGYRIGQIGTASLVVAAWLLTLPAAALVAGVVWYLTDGLGGDSAGPPVLFALAVAGAIGLFVVAQRRPVTPADV